jgi:serine acetyltransferase
VIFAAVNIGDGAFIGPNAVVMSHVPAGARVFTEAPRVIRLPDDSDELRPIRSLAQSK